MDEAERREELQVMPLIPLRGLTVYPNMVINFDVGREKSILALERAMMMNQTVFLTSQKDIDTDLPTTKDFFHVGTVAKFKQMLKLPGDSIRVLVEGEVRGRIKDVIMEVEVGDRVITGKYTGTEVKLDGEELTIVKQSEILAIVE